MKSASATGLADWSCKVKGGAASPTESLSVMAGSYGGGPGRDDSDGGYSDRPRYRHTVSALSAPDDLDIGAFSDNPPWQVDLDQLAWRHGMEELRRRTSAEVPDLLRRRRLPPGRRVVTVGVGLG